MNLLHQVAHPLPDPPRCSFQAVSSSMPHSFLVPFALKLVVSITQAKDPFHISLPALHECPTRRVSRHERPYSRIQRNDFLFRLMVMNRGEWEDLTQIEPTQSIFDDSRVINQVIG